MAEPNWDGEQGGFDDFEYTIEEAKFGFDEKYDAAAGKNVPSFIMHGEAVLSDGNHFPGSKQRYGIGKFDAVDGGKRATHESGDETKQFNYQSGYMNFVRAARSCGAKEIIEQRCDGDPLNLRNADIWVGLKFRLKRTVAGQRQNEAGEDVDYSFLLPVEFLGEVGGKQVPVQAAVQTTNGNPPASINALEELAAGLDDKMEFLDQAVRGKGADISEAEKIWDKVKS